LRGWDKGVNFKQKYAGVYILPKKIKTFPQPIFERKKLFHSFRKDLLVTFGKVFVILRWKHFHKISDFGNFSRTKKILFWKIFIPENMITITLMQEF